ncbi:hypothetical protein V0U79_09160 [Hyphobacterium sp. HN65]|uniref:Transmembrane protein n=1 Tax=Hyphobacterium lacteum TaxID=3116575 RepID=A0ABU7LRJ5_9PROT|nr:hypothetical protein [Hyphobacterium sp. HN65]MEE2526534.1 hypothetical protein [Hyphobacterium sp. HN65]
MTEAAEVPQKPLIRKGSITRLVVSFLLLSPVLATSVFRLLDIYGWWSLSPDQSNWAVLCAVLFPPVWCLLIIVYFAQPEGFSSLQQKVLVAGAFLFLWFLMIIWLPGMLLMTQAAYDFMRTYGQEAWVPGAGIGLYIIGWVLAVMAGYYVLRSLPPPLGHRVRLY